MAAPTPDGRYYNSPNDVSAVIGAEAANAITVNIQLLAGAAEITERAAVHIYQSSDANGDVPVAAQTSLALGTDGSLLGTLTAATSILALSEADGDIDIVITDTGAVTRYLQVVLPQGTKKTIGPITFV